MKRYEKMSKEEILEVVKLCKTVDACTDCKLKDYYDDPHGCEYAYLTAELERIPRWKTAKSQEDMDKLLNECVTYCNGQAVCHDCDFHQASNGGISYRCYHAFLSELVEVPE